MYYCILHLKIIIYVNSTCKFHKNVALLNKSVIDMQRIIGYRRYLRELPEAYLISYNIYIYIYNIISCIRWEMLKKKLNADKSA